MKTAGLGGGGEHAEPCNPPPLHASCSMTREGELRKVSSGDANPRRKTFRSDKTQSWTDIANPTSPTSGPELGTGDHVDAETALAGGSVLLLRSAGPIT